MGACGSAGDAVARASAGGTARTSAAVLEGDCAVEAGVSPVVVVRWFREGGGMATVSLAAPSGRYLSFAEREEIALLRAAGCGVREVARRLGRSPSMISRELRRRCDSVWSP